MATRGATPAQAMVLAAFFNTLGPLLVGAAVADTIGGIVAVDGRAAIEVIGAGLVAAVAWNLLTWWLGLPSSSGHALVGGLVGAALVEGGTDAVQWGGLDGLRPVGVIGTAIALAVAPVLGALAALVTTRALRRGLRRATAAGATRSASASGRCRPGSRSATAPTTRRRRSACWRRCSSPTGGSRARAHRRGLSSACAAALTAGTAIGGWRIVKKVGRGIYRIQPAEGLASQAASAGVIFGASLAGAPVSTSQVVASSIVGVGGGRRRWRHVRWAAVGDMALAWVLTIPATAVLGGLILLVLGGIA